MKKLLLLSFLIVACGKVESADVRQEKIFTSYSATQDEDKMRTDFVATFSTSAGEVSDNSVRLTGGSSVLLDGQTMVENVSAIGGYSYRARRGIASSKDDEKKDFNLEYIDNNGKAYKNKISLPGRVTIDPPSEASIAAGFSVPWRIEDRLGIHEKLNLSLRYKKGDFYDTLILEDQSPSLSEGRIEFSSSQTKEISPQRAEVKLCRNRSFPQLEAPAIGGIMEASYCTTSRLILLK